MRVNSVQADTRGINSRNDQIRPDVSLVPEEVLLQHRHAGDYSRRPACGERVQFDVGADQRRGEFGIGCCAGASAPDLRGNVVDFFAVLFVVTDLISLQELFWVERFWDSSIPCLLLFRRWLLWYLLQSGHSR